MWLIKIIDILHLVGASCNAQKIKLNFLTTKACQNRENLKPRVRQPNTRVVPNKIDWRNMKDKPKAMRCFLCHEQESQTLQWCKAKTIDATQQTHQPHYKAFNVLLHHLPQERSIIFIVKGAKRRFLANKFSAGCRMLWASFIDTGWDQSIPKEISSNCRWGH